MLDQMTLPDTPNATSLPASAFGPTPCDVQAGPIAALFGQALAPANLSARQAKEMGLLTSGICGRHGFTSLPSASLQQSLVSKLQAKTALLGSTLFSLTWKQRATPGGAVDLCAAGVGAPHIRQRLWIFAELADSLFAGWPERRTSARGGQATGSIRNGVVGNAHDAGLEGFRGGYQTPGGGAGPLRPIATSSELGGMDDAESTRGRWGQPLQDGRHSEFRGSDSIQSDGRLPSSCPSTRPTNGHWHSADWLFCRDGKWRPVEPGTFPLANGAPARVGRLRAYGNAINAEAAEAFIKAYMECRP